MRRAVLTWSAKLNQRRSLAVGKQLVDFVNTYCVETDTALKDFSPFAIVLGNDMTQQMMYPNLIKEDPHLLRLLFVLLRQWNSMLLEVSPYIDLSSTNRKHKWSLGNCLSRLRSLIFMQVKQKFLKKAYRSLPSSRSANVKLNRLPLTDAQKEAAKQKIIQKGKIKGTNTQLLDIEEFQWCLFVQAFLQLHPSDQIQRLRSTSQAFSGLHVYLLFP